MTRQGKRTSVGPLAAHMDGFRSFALAWGYTTATTGRLVRQMRSMSAWMLETGYDVGDVSKGLVASYRAWLSGSGRRRVPTPGEFRVEWPSSAPTRAAGDREGAAAVWPGGGAPGRLDPELQPFRRVMFR